jgi:hypothetical protein
MLDTTWRSDGLGGYIEEDDVLVGVVRLVDDWHEEGQREGRRAWVVDWTAEGTNIAQRSLIELDGGATIDEHRIAELSEKAKDVVDLGPPAAPLAFGFVKTGLTSNQEIRALIQVSSYALESAEGRLQAAAEEHGGHAAVRLNVAVVEVAGWMRGLDDLLRFVWRDRVTPRQREDVSREADRVLSGPTIPSTFLADVRAARHASGQPYVDWNIALFATTTYIPNDQLKGFRWLAGKLLHHGTLSAVELVQWRAGEQPRWKWRSANDIFPPALHEKRPGQRAAYEHVLAGKDVLGSVNLTMAVYELQDLFVSLLP